MEEKIFQKILKAQRARKAKKLFERGLEAKELAFAKILGESEPRLLLLCSTPKGKVYAFACEKKPLFLLGKRLKLAPSGEARVLENPEDWVNLEGELEGLRAPLVVARGVEPC